MQGWRQPQPSGTNRPSSYPSHPRGRCFHVLGGCNSTQVDQDIRSGELAVRPPGHAEGHPLAWEARNRHKTSAAHRSAAMAGGARPDPFRTRKLSRRAPMVLRGKPVGEQGAADRWTALDPFSRARARGRRGGLPPRRPLSQNSVLLSRPSVFPLQREMRRAFPMLAVLGAMRPIEVGISAIGLFDVGSGFPIGPVCLLWPKGHLSSPMLELQAN